MLGFARSEACPRHTSSCCINPLSKLQKFWPWLGLRWPLYSTSEQMLPISLSVLAYSKVIKFKQRGTGAVLRRAEGGYSSGNLQLL